VDFSQATDSGQDQVNGGDGDDVLYTSQFAASTLNGDDGNDWLTGYIGADNLNGGRR
jgi:Ca2+-binding RTX toxin-like protein